MSWRIEHEALGVVLNALEPLEPAEQARVLLWAILRYAPNALTDDELLKLVRLGMEPAAGPQP
jgi:hypothetical protein